ncbi:AEC family transporter [Thalassospira sp. UBA4513]|uniref:AEC family transporter n=1 Tax=Thalassospira TaxID=168934 RepID=UPI0025805273|nr:AEC family transporter [Thalassospira sp. UBA4513]|tara:strand:+ start:1056 stop:2006 length:951 start_codon:yes stop_codon:yes gene_type:complete
MSQITSIILPFFALIGLGWIGGKFKIVSPDGMRGINGFVFYFALPALLFKALATRSPSEIWQPDIILAYGGGTLVVYGISRLIASRVFHLDPASQTLFSFAGTMGNVGFMGLPLIIGLLGPLATVPLIVALAVDLIVMLPLSLLLLEGTKHAKGTHPTAKIIRGTLTNPVVLAIIIGVLASLLDLDWPDGVDYLLDLLGQSAGPAALFAIGVALVGRPIAEKRAELATMSVAKLIVHPIAVFIGFWIVGSASGLETKAVLLLAALPTAGNVFVIATTYDRYIVRSSSIVLVTTALGVVSFSIFSVYIETIVGWLGQ